jgi:hypothetical protein
MIWDTQEGDQIEVRFPWSQCQSLSRDSIKEAEIFVIIRIYCYSYRTTYAH